MKLTELCEWYKVKAKEVLDNPEKYDNRELLQASILLRRNLEKALTTLAKRNGNCISCIYSKPSERQPLNIALRDCELGLDKSNCSRWKWIIESSEMG